MSPRARHHRRPARQDDRDARLRRVRGLADTVVDMEDDDLLDYHRVRPRPATPQPRSGEDTVAAHINTSEGGVAPQR